jgi:Cytochrome P460
MLRRTLVTTATLAMAVSAFGALAMHHELPLGYRTWGHVKSMVITDKSHGLYGFHSTYANPAALEALRSGKAFPKGAEFVTSFYEVATEGPVLSQGKKIMDAYMKKDDGAKQTGGWWFNAFGPDGRPLGIDVVKGCYECHANGAKGTDLVFSKFVD